MDVLIPLKRATGNVADFWLVFLQCSGSRLLRESEAKQKELMVLTSTSNLPGELWLKRTGTQTHSLQKIVPQSPEFCFLIWHTFNNVYLIVWFTVRG